MNGRPSTSESLRKLSSSRSASTQVWACSFDMDASLSATFAFSWTAFIQGSVPRGASGSPISNSIPVLIAIDVSQPIHLRSKIVFRQGFSFHSKLPFERTVDTDDELDLLFAIAAG